MDTYALSVAREYVATAIANLENARAVLLAGDAFHQADELERTIAIVSRDLRLVANAWREAKSEAGTAGV